MTTHTLLHKTIIFILWKWFWLNTVILFSYDMGSGKLGDVMTDLVSIGSFTSAVCFRYVANHLLKY